MSLELAKRINSFKKLGQIIGHLDTDTHIANENKEIISAYNSLNVEIQNCRNYNPWFTKENVKHAILAISEMLNGENLNNWLAAYTIPDKLQNPKNIAVVMAGNIPLVGFHDFLCVLISGNNFIGKLSSDDKRLLPALSKLLIAIEPDFSEKIEFADNFIRNFDAVIATGSNNTARYFEYYFGKYPNIIRKNRNGVAVISGNETEEDFKALGEDIFMYFGLGCRNISKLFVPENYSFNAFFQSIEDFKQIFFNHKYKNNYDYYRSIYLVNSEKHLDNGFLLLKESQSFASPVSIIYYEYYKSQDELLKHLVANNEKIQCIVSNDSDNDKQIPFGKSQFPNLPDYADGVDTLKFLLGLSNI
ncbi:MAG: aldehyde dehydrogenase [Bacteroidales bacterium]|nr:aldehyde dehydrogenase [Bacteroidales bacterium]